MSNACAGVTQGDIEKSLGKTPIPLMDRSNKDNLSKDEVGNSWVHAMSCASECNHKKVYKLHFKLMQTTTFKVNSASMLVSLKYPRS